jgi:hypothetical protein
MKCSYLPSTIVFLSMVDLISKYCFYDDFSSKATYPSPIPGVKNDKMHHTIIVKYAT